MAKLKQEFDLLPVKQLLFQVGGYVGALHGSETRRAPEQRAFPDLPEQTSGEPSPSQSHSITT